MKGFRLRDWESKNFACDAYRLQYLIAHNFPVARNAQLLGSDMMDLLIKVALAVERHSGKLKQHDEKFAEMTEPRQTRSYYIRELAKMGVKTTDRDSHATLKKLYEEHLAKPEPEDTKGAE